MTARAVRLTPSGAGGVATVAVVGPGAWAVVRPLFRTAKGEPAPEQPPPPGTLRFGRFGAPPGDEVVLASGVALAPREDLQRFEVHCHGGPQLVDWLLEQLAAGGAELVPWVELERIATGSWLRAAAAEQLSKALTLKTANVLLEQYNGAFEAEVRRLFDLVTANDAAAAGQIAALLGRWRMGQHLTAPWRVAVLGPPNVGKSSLVNALAGFERAVVTPVPGTTRDAVTTLVAFDGWPVELIDTAGVHDTAHEVEQEGIRRGREAAQKADVRVWVTDATAPVLPPSDLHADIVVENKIDLTALRTAGTVPVSALTGEGIPAFIARLVAVINPALPAGAAVPVSAAVTGLITQAADAAGRADWGAAAAALRALLQPDRPP